MLSEQPKDQPHDYGNEYRAKDVLSRINRKDQPVNELRDKIAKIMYRDGGTGREVDSMFLLCQAECNRARVKAITDVDNLNLLNGSDEWHEWYLAELQQIMKGQS